MARLDGHHSGGPGPVDPEDLDEARSRLRRLAEIWEARLRALPDERLDSGDGYAWTPRQVAFHVSGSAFYGDSVARLSP